MNNVSFPKFGEVICPLKKKTEKFFSISKSLTSSFDGFAKLSGVVSPAVALFKLYHGQSAPSWAEKVEEDLKSLQAIRSGFGWTNVGYDLHTKPWGREFLPIAKRIMSISISLLFTLDYLERVVDGLKVSSLFTISNVSLKIIFIEATVAISFIERCISLHEIRKIKFSQRNKLDAMSNNSGDTVKVNNRIQDRLRALNSELNGVKTLNREECKQIQNEITSKKQKIIQNEIKIKQSKRHKHLASGNIRLHRELESLKAKLNQQYKLRWIKRIDSIDAKNDFHKLKKKSEMLKLLINLEESNKKDLRSLYKMNKGIYKNYKIKQLHVRQENISLLAKQNKISAISDFAKMIIFGVGIGKAYYGGTAVLSQIFGLDTLLFEKLFEGLKLNSGLIALGKYFFDEKTFHPDIRPSACVA